MNKFIIFNEDTYPKFQSEGNAAQFAMPFAKHLLTGTGVDIGCSKLEWSFPGSIPIDLSLPGGYHANNLPDGTYDYIFSSHCLEHVDRWTDTLNYWTSYLRKGGIMFLYLPHYSQKYWRPWNNNKHVNILTDVMLRDFFESTEQYTNILVTEGYDLNNSFYAIAEKI